MKKLPKKLLPLIKPLKKQLSVLTKKATETGAVNGFNKVSDKFIEKFFTKDGESVEEAKKRLAASAEKSKARSKDINKKAKSHKY